MNETIIRPAIFSGVTEIFAAFTTRHFADDSRSAAEASASRLADEEGFFGTTFTEQVHGNRVAAVSAPGRVAGHDGLVTRRPGLLLGTVAADCALLLLADAENGVVGTCHAGWRGAVAGIVPNTIAAMTEVGATPERVLAYVGPCISAEKFEVGEEVAEKFNADFVHRRPDWERPHVDLRKVVRMQLLDAGLPEEHIEISEACTMSSPELFFSYRGEEGTHGRMLGLIGLLSAV
jgi:polyphenol oxidase